MHHNIFTAIEIAVRGIARRNLSPQDYENLILNIRKSKIIKIGHDNITLHEYIMIHANDIANWATNNRFQEAEDKVEEKKRKAVHAIASAFGWETNPQKEI